MLEPQRPLGRDSRNFPTRGEEGGGASAAGEGRAGGRAGRSRPAPGLSACGAALRGCSGGFPAAGRPAHAHSRASRLAHNEGGGPARARPPTLPSGSARQEPRSDAQELVAGRSSPGKHLLTTFLWSLGPAASPQALPVRSLSRGEPGKAALGLALRPHPHTVHGPRLARSQLSTYSRPSTVTLVR